MQHTRSSTLGTPSRPYEKYEKLDMPAEGFDVNLSSFIVIISFTEIIRGPQGTGGPVLGQKNID